MKKWMLYTIGTIFIVGIIGGFFINHEINASTYNSSMKNGRTEIRKSQYNAAQTNFQRAAKIKPDSMEVNNLLSQTSKFVAGENKFKDYDFNEAASDFNDVLNYDQGSSVLESRAKVELKVLKQVSKNVNRLKKIYNQALEQNKAKEFTASNNTLDDIFDDDLSSNAFYADIVKEAKKLKAANDNRVVLSKFKAKKISSTDNKKKKTKKTKKITKAPKETTAAIHEVNKSVVPTVNNSSNNSNDSSSDSTSKQVSNSQTSTTNSSSTNAPARSYQPAKPAPAEKHDSVSNSNNSNQTPPSNNKPDNGGSTPQGNGGQAPSTPPADSQGNAPSTVTPSN
ncbi:hypothetical protein EQU06_06475 [Lactobacillus sanfranciscensis]|uniref:Tetratricopeptide repeat protein n=1 Tax=Fructilactobacillus sanfranciscensis (strain TMW 1.1304) TaxID=714313 RepID=G2KUM5_FRUST|nr:hypothetical protein [Fructilactobacillus sanfranciscensis]AEN99623.1 hypothetical protein LSA_12530 [Fructilactobacillus sanfranciscensis TMW 1.1304]NDR76451.1 hypothetical protein [Fructilactobacillus sanfranciscensis]NDR97072.1 hypothetical protein [Fructilactobacillus sanfranciscensis]NDS04980.1 hypothetical protein [Fructilactobacillus sanfranciscensis]POH18550.1 hypothetical protein BGL44_06225 [Fructilactobacillus sanfranciscensis]